MYASFLSSHGDPGRAARQFGRLIGADPRDEAARIGRARALARSGAYDDAVGDFEAYLALAPGDPRARREEARALARAGRFDEAQAAYGEALRLDPVARVVSLERAAKRAVWDGRDEKALLAAERWLGEEAGSPEALIEIAQAQCRLGRCGESEGPYRAILEADSADEEARIGLEAAKLAGRPAASAGYRYEKAAGFNSRISFGLHEGRAGLELPGTLLSLSCRSSASFEYARSAFLFPGLETSEVNRFGLSARHRGREGGWAEISYALRHYEDEGRARHEGGAQVGARFFDAVEPRLGIERSDWIENGRMLQEGIFVDRAYLEADAPHALGRLALGAGASYARVRDDNRRVGAEGRVGYEVLPAPLSLLFGTTGRYVAFRDRKALYFSPRDYFRADLSAEWRHDLSPRRMCGAPRIDYALRYAAGLDDEGTVFHTGLARARWDVSGRLSLAGEVEVVRSSEYDSERAGISADLHF